MGYQIITADKFKPVSWSGGTSTELFIFPLTSVYQQLNFEFRLSKATVETDKSDFTVLPGISRKLMILSGKITISHEGHYSRQLDKFEVDEFEGSWKTTSIGKCTDFNLMTSGKITGKLHGMVIKDKQKVSHEIKKNSDWLFIYMNSGKVSLEINNKIANIGKDELLLLNKPTLAVLEIKGVEHSELVFAEIYY
jgi:environmental stress-induced protein Ves